MQSTQQDKLTANPGAEAPLLAALSSDLANLQQQPDCEISVEGLASAVNS